MSTEPQWNCFAKTHFLRFFRNFVHTAVPTHPFQPPFLWSSPLSVCSSSWLSSWGHSIYSLLTRLDSVSRVWSGGSSPEGTQRDLWDINGHGPLASPNLPVPPSPCGQQWQHGPGPGSGGERLHRERAGLAHLRVRHSPAAQSSQRIPRQWRRLSHRVLLFLVSKVSVTSLKWSSSLSPACC